jgi:peptidase E
MTGRRILALGGHDFDRRDGNDSICDLIVDLAETPRPRICLLPTASGDSQGQISRFRRAFGERDCVPSVLSLFRLGENPVNLRDELLGQDVIYVGGGSLLNLLAIWRTHGLDRIMGEAWERGIVLCGQSAGAMCWFEFGITSSTGAASARRGLGLLPGSLCVHYGRDPERRGAFREAVAFGIPAGYGLDDGAGILFRGTEMAEAVSARPGARVLRVEPSDGARSSETSVPVHTLRDPRPALDDPLDELVELRHTRAARIARAP